MTSPKTASNAGFSLIDLLLVIALVSTLAGIAVPAATNAAELMRLGFATREVERQLQSARLRSVSTNRPLAVRLNCPTAGQLRVVEITGVASTDGDANRCDENRFPYPGPNDADPATPAVDGPVRRLHTSIALSGSDLLFSPNGTTQRLAGTNPTRISNSAALTVSRDLESSSILVNSLGKIAIQ